MAGWTSAKSEEAIRGRRIRGRRRSSGQVLKCEWNRRRQRIVELLGFGEELGQGLEGERGGAFGFIVGEDVDLFVFS